MQAQSIRADRKTYTVSDWEKLPEFPRYELHDGEAVMLASPSFPHQDACDALITEFRTYLKGKECKAVSGFAVKLEEHKDSVFIPDLVVVCDPKKITDGYVIGAPDLVIEIQAPSTAKYDRLLKFNAYRDAGVLEYWIVDPIHKTVEVFFWRETPVPVQYAGIDKVKVGIFDDLEIDLKEIFGETQNL
ncbi:MAG: Uma2 family endonuclease [Oscillospiraceae bacterium]|jgi:Uma2 family endonuclease|nr:Uma2 family endonuclease [Oscillospiraceae bacterium]